MNAHGAGGGHLAQQVIASQEDTVLLAGCRHEGEAVVGRQAAMLPLQREHPRNLFAWKVIGGEATIFEHLPFLRREIEEFLLADGQRHNEPIGQPQQDVQQRPFL